MSFIEQTATVGRTGTFTIGTNGEWTFTANSAFNELNVGESITERFCVTMRDGTTQVVRVRITGTNDAAIITGTSSKTLSETDAAITTGGTLISADVDNISAFTAQSGVIGTNGTFSIGTNGVWSYTANSAFDSLNVGDSVIENFTVSTVDGTTHIVTVTINGANDAAVIRGDISATIVETDVPVTVTGQLAVADIDNQALFVVQTDTGGIYGRFSVDDSGFWSYIANSAFDELNTGEVLTENFIVSAVDGTTEVVTVTITGTNEILPDGGSVAESVPVLSSSGTKSAAIITGDINASVLESNTFITATGNLSVASNPLPFVAESGRVGSTGIFSIGADGLWNFTANSVFDGLNVGETVKESFTVSTVDGMTEVVTVTITGTNDAAVISGDFSANVLESNALITATGRLSAVDIDNPAIFSAQSGITGMYGVFDMGSDGAWSYRAGSAFDSLNIGDTVTESFTVSTVDGTSELVTVTIAGTNDAAVITGDSSASFVETNAAITVMGRLLVNDVDNPAAFVAQSESKGRTGTFSIGTDGIWSYTANSAFDGLNAGGKVKDFFSVFTSDGTSQVVSVTITGANDAAIITGDLSSTVFETNAAVSITGRLRAMDVDNPSIFVAQNGVMGLTGAFSIGMDGVWHYRANSAFDSLNVGETVTESFSVSTVDGTSEFVKVTIEGTDDASVVTGDFSASVAETDAAITTMGQLTVTDIDSSFAFVAQSSTTGNLGVFSIGIDGAWDFRAGSTFDNLNVGDTLTESFAVSTIDGTSDLVTVTITGTNDAAVITGSLRTSADEGDAAIMATGTLSATDVDSSSAFVAQTDVAGTNGTFSIGTDGVWIYSANSAFDGLNVGSSVTESFTVTTVDGTSEVVTVTINGTNDAAVISGDFSASVAETNDIVTATGHLTVTDVDNPALFVIQTDNAGVNGRFSIDGDGFWSYSSSSAFDYLNEGDSLVESFSVESADGTSQIVMLAIMGTNDAAVISGDFSASVAETNVPITATGHLTVTDVDNPALFVVQTNTGGLNGSFSIDDAGLWSYAANSAFDYLNAGDTLVESFTVSTVDGTTEIVTVTITGTNDALTTSQIVTQLTTSWGSGLTGYTFTWPADLSSISYAINEGTPTNVAGFTPSEGGSSLVQMSALQVATARLSFQLLDDIMAKSSGADHRLVQIADPSANITLNYSSNTGGGTYTISFGTVDTVTQNFSITAEQIWLSSAWSSNSDIGMSLGSYGLFTMIHEIGHALGLSHPGVYDAGNGGTITYQNNAAFAEDNRKYTVMSYFGGYLPGYGWYPDGTYSSFIFPQTPMLYDIAAIQALHGADTVTRAGDTVYGFNCNLALTDSERAIYDFTSNTAPIFTIWDAGGMDTIDCSGFTTQQIINLNPGTYSSLSGMTENVAIAFDCTIERAVGGSGNDVLIGSAALNYLNGGNGSDIYIVNRAGDHFAAEIADTGATGSDEVRFASTIEHDTLTLFAGETGIERVVIGTGIGITGVTTGTTSLNVDASAVLNPLVITGNAGANILTGTAYNDVLYGGKGNDILNGGNGSDIYHIFSSDEHTSAEFSDTGTTGNDDVRFGSTTANDTLTLYAGDRGIERVTATGTTALNIDASGVLNGLLITGNAGSNTLNGTAYSDTYTGGSGADTFVFDSHQQAPINSDTILDFQSGSDVLAFSKGSYSSITSSEGGLLSSAEFWSEAGATVGHDSDDRIVYDATTGKLYYDSDGNGSANALLVALIGTTAHPSLLYTDISIVL
ncbi:hypothetical protein G9409_08530 [Chlorobium sp. BLA1]|nr:hypothetical protein [Candidatus Chlorobium masyuteum]